MTLLLLANNFGFAQKYEEQQVRNTFNKYKAAITKAKGEEAVKYIDNATLNHYDLLLDIIKREDSLAFQKLKYMDKKIVLSIGQRLTKKEAEKFDKTDLFVFAVKNRIVGNTSLPYQSIGDVIIDADGKSAKGQFVSNGDKKSLYLYFYKEEEKWKLNLSSIIENLNSLF